MVDPFTVFKLLSLNRTLLICCIDKPEPVFCSKVIFFVLLSFGDPSLDKLVELFCNELALVDVVVLVEWLDPNGEAGKEDSGGKLNATMYPPLFELISAGLPVVTSSVPLPIDGPPMPIGAPTLNSQSF